MVDGRRHVTIKIFPNFRLSHLSLNDADAMIPQRFDKVLVRQHQHLNSIIKTDWIEKLSQVQEAATQKLI
jgi:hypothetical protein